LAQFRFYGNSLDSPGLVYNPLEEPSDSILLQRTRAGAGHVLEHFGFPARRINGKALFMLQPPYFYGALSAAIQQFDEPFID
jgi:hypothetical protein